MKYSDSGIVVFRSDTKQYYCGLNTWDKQLRKAKIYHQKRWAEEAIDSFVNDRNKPLSRNIFSMHGIEIKVTSEIK